VAGDEKSAQNRGRLQAQGPDIEEPGPAFAWAQSRPPSKVAAQAGLHTMQQACTKSQLARRTVAFSEAGTFVAAGPYEAPPPVLRSFFNRNLPSKFRSCRVDVEIWKGGAFT
jgi:hypothetical protein